MNDQLDAHREHMLVALEQARMALDKRECTIYTTLEPCMMCLGAIVNVGIESLVVGAQDRAVGALQLLPHGEYYHVKQRRMQLLTGVLAAESQSLLDEYVNRTSASRLCQTPSPCHDATGCR